MRRRAAALLVACTACTPQPAPRSTATPGPKFSGPPHARGGCRYDVRVANGSLAKLEVELSCERRTLPRLRSTSPAVARVVEVLGSDGAPLSPHDGAWSPGNDVKSVRYRVDLEALAAAGDDFDLALRIGDSLIAPGSSFLLEPVPLPVGATMTVAVTPAPGAGFASALDQHGAEWRLEAQEIHVATYSVFGRFTKTTLELPGRSGAGSSSLDVVVLDAPLALSRPELDGFIGESARAVADFWHGFPLERAMIAVMPVAKRNGIVFGKLLPASRPGIALMLGAETRAGSLHDDWVLVHELFHIGSPSFLGEGKWLDEGIATYFEPIIRARAGWLSERRLWEELAPHMPEGLPGLQEEGLEHASSYRSIYWGGASVALFADVAAREKSGGKLGLEDGFRAVLGRGGTACEVWDLADTIDTVDQTLGGPILGELAKRYAYAAAPVDFDALWRDLGVELRSGKVTLSDSAPKAWVRKAILRGAAP